MPEGHPKDEVLETPTPGLCLSACVSVCASVRRVTVTEPDEFGSLPGVFPLPVLSEGPTDPRGSGGVRVVRSPTAGSGCIGPQGVRHGSYKGRT